MIRKSAKRFSEKIMLSSFRTGDLFALWWATTRSSVGASPRTGRVVTVSGKYRLV